MNCDVIKDLIPMYIEGRCSEASGQTVEEHLNTCAECKKIYEDMKSSKEAGSVLKTQKAFNKLKKIILNKKFIIISAITLVIIILIGIYWYRHPTHFLYDDRWIIGKSVYQIEDRYGEYDVHFDNIDGGFSKGYCTKPGDHDPLFGEPIWPMYYMIKFDKDGIAVDVEMEEGGWGG